MKHIEVIALRAKLQGIKALNGLDLNFCIKENIAAIEIAVKSLVQIEEENKSIIAKFTEEHKALRKKHATIDGDIKYKLIHNQRIFDIPEANKKVYEADLLALKKKHKKDLDAFEKKAEEYSTFVNTGESPFKPIKIAKSLLPGDISSENFDAVWELIEK